MGEDQRLRLPAFVDAPALDKLLNWPASLRRQFLEIARRKVVDWPDGIDEAAAAVAELLSRPGGARRIEDLVAQVDPSKRRGLRAALRRGRTLGMEGEQPVGTVADAADLCEQVRFEDAAWSALLLLASADPRREGSQAADMAELIAAQAGLRRRLGDYWTDWQALAAGQGEAAPPAPGDPAEAWAREVERLRDALAGAQSFDPALPERLRVAAATLGALGERAAGEADRRAAERAAAAARWAAALAGLHAVAGGAELASLAGADVTGEAAAVLDEAAGWAIAATAALTEAEEAFATAAARFAADDSEAADEALVATRKRRRAARAALATEAAEWLARWGCKAAATTPRPAPVAAAAPPDPVPNASPAPAVAPAATPEPVRAPAATAPAPSNPDPEPETAAAEEIAKPLDHAAAEHGRSSELDAFLPPAAASAVDDDGAVLAAATRRALGEGRYGLASHLDAAARALGMAGLAGDSAALRALAVGAAVSAARVTPAATAYARLAPAIFAAAEREEPASAGTRLLLIAGAIKPAIFASQTGAAEVFRQAEPGGFGSVLHDLCELLGDMPKRGGHLDFADLAPAADAQTRRRAADALRDQLLGLADTAPDRRAVFQRATDIMVSVLGDGPVGEAVAAIRRNAPGAAEKALAGAHWLDDDLDRRVTALDDAARKPRRGAPLEGKARRWLVPRLGEAAALLRRWAAADRAAQGAGAGHAGEVRAQLRQLVAAALDVFARCGGDPDARLAADVAARVFAEVMRLLDGEEVGDPRLDLAMLLDDELLLFHPYPALGGDGEWTAPAAHDLAEGVGAVLDAPADYSAAFRRLADRGRFAEAAAAIGRIVAEGGERRLLDEQLRDKRHRRREALAGDAARLRRKLDDVLGADTAGRVDLTLQGKVERLATDLDQPAETIDFPEAEARMRDLEQQVGDLFDLLLAPLRAELDGLDLPPRTAATLRRLADKGDLTTLREHVEAAKMGVDIGAPVGRRLQAFATRFLSPAYDKVAAADRNTAALIEAARARRETPAADFSQLGEEDVAGATELLAAWRDLKAAKADPQRALPGLFAALRFTSVKVTAGQPLPPARRFALTCDRIADRALCPVPAFGSAARGGYAVLLVEAVAVSSGSELYKLLARQESATTRPTFILAVGGPLPASRRLEFMREARKGGAASPCALIDEATVLSLASRPGRGLADLFAVTLPTGAVQPYSDANGQTSPEMFFGRRDELIQLWDPSGSCLVYGGRQLGKTALLEQLRLRHHRPPTQVVVGGSIDGKTDIWPWLAERLREAGVPVKASYATAVCDAVGAWLKGDGARRILVLADEADIYLAAQMKGDYGSLIKVRDLMQSTERRCKFAFAGLHNVQRLARQPNSPLLHFGTPLRVGPLYREDLGEARAMLEQPMAAAGFTFGSEALPGRVLSELGYYPSLLQTFGRTMIERLNRVATTRLSPAAPLPIVIAETDIDEALEDQQFRTNVSGKFEATLSLDERYRLITYAMLVHTMDAQGQSPALSDVAVQELALGWWPQGFAEDRTLDAFQGLLQEMVGLGVLIETEGRYAIRSSRIGGMLGGPKEIEKKLLEMSEMPGHQELDTGSLRRLDPDHAPSPLTARQEGVMLAAAAPPVQLVLGSKALGVDALAASLEALPDDDTLVVEAAGYANRAQLLARVDRTPERRTLLVLSGPWPGASMVAELMHSEAVRKSRRGSRRSLQVLLAPVTVDWAELGEVGGGGRFAGAELLTLAPLGDTGLRQWLRAAAGGDPADAVAELRALTGGFPLFLQGLKGAAPAAVLAQARTAHARLCEGPAALAALGLADPQLRRAAELLVQLGHEPGIEDVLRDEGVAQAGAALAQLERLGVLEPPARAGAAPAVNGFVATLLAGRA